MRARVLGLGLLLASPAGANEAQRYAMRHEVVVQVKDPNPFRFSRWTDQSTIAVGFVDWERDGEVVRYVQTTCSLVTTQVFGTQITYPPAFIATLAGRERVGRVVDGGVHIGPYVDVVGAEPGDDLPTEPDQAIDTDGDGFPGVTIHVKQSIMGEGDAYAAQRSITRIHLSPEGDGYTGVVSSRTEMSVVDATAFWLKSSRPVREHPDPNASTVELVPVDGSVDCAAVLSDAPRLFSAPVDSSGR